MASNEWDSSVGSRENSSERQATSSDSDGGTSTSGSLYHVASQIMHMMTNLWLNQGKIRKLLMILMEYCRKLWKLGATAQSL